MPRLPIRGTTLVSARFFCSDGDCEVEGELIGPLAELDSLCCDCGAALQIIGWPERAPRHRGRELEIYVLE